MTDQITTMELEKAAHNLGRLSEYVGVRCRWTVATDGASAAEDARKSTEAIAEIIGEMTGGDIATPVGVKQPPELEPAGEVSAGRLTRFAEYLDQLRRWFESHGGTELPSGSEDATRSIQRSLAVTGDALRLLLDPEARKPDPEPQATVESDPEMLEAIEPGPLTRDDLGPVAEVDTEARLILDHTWQKPLLQKFKEMLELTPKTRDLLDAFIKDQGMELNSHEIRRLREKVQRWIELTPNGRVLVLRIGGLSGKPEVYSSFQPLEGPEETPEVEKPVDDNGDELR